MNLIVNSNLEKIAFEGCFIPHFEKLDFNIDKNLEMEKHLNSIAFVKCEFEKRMSTVIIITSAFKELKSVDLSENDFTEEEVNQITNPEEMKDHSELANIDSIIMHNNKKDLSAWLGKKLVC